MCPVPPSSCMPRAGDRVGVCLAGLDAKLMERGVVTTPGSVKPISAAIALVRKVPSPPSHRLVVVVWPSSWHGTGTVQLRVSPSFYFISMKYMWLCLALLSLVVVLYCWLYLVYELNRAWSDGLGKWETKYCCRNLFERWFGSMFET